MFYGKCGIIIYNMGTVKNKLSDSYKQIWMFVLVFVLVGVIGLLLSNAYKKSDVSTKQTGTSNVPGVQTVSISPEFVVKVDGVDYTADKNFPAGVLDARVVSVDVAKKVITADVDVKRIFPGAVISSKRVTIKLAQGAEIKNVEIKTREEQVGKLSDLVQDDGISASLLLSGNGSRDIFTNNEFVATKIFRFIPESQ